MQTEALNAPTGSAGQRRRYPIGEKVPKGYKKSMRILFDEELPAWNYRAVPANPGS